MMMLRIRTAIELLSITRRLLYRLSKRKENSLKSAILLIRHSKYKIHSYRLLFRRFCPLGKCFKEDVVHWKTFIWECVYFTLFAKFIFVEYIWADGEAQGCPFEIGISDPSNANSIGYMAYNKDGSVFGYGSRFSVVPELKLSTFCYSGA